MTPAHIKTTLAALASIATPAHLRNADSPAVSASPAPTPVAGAAPQGVAPRAAEAGFSWDEVVGEMNARNGFGPSPAAAPAAGTVSQAPAAPRASHTSELIDWDAAVAAVNAENGCTHPGANPDPKLAAMLSGGLGR